MSHPAPQARTGELVRELFDPSVRSVATPLFADLDDLLPEERVFVGRAVSRRRREFATARVCARRLMRELGVPEAPLLTAGDRAPIWPHRVVGSISHSGELCLVAVALRGAVQSLGIDVEPDEPLQPDLWRVICTPEERLWLGSQSPSERGGLARLMFSAKECFYKCQYPITRQRLEFHDVIVTVFPEAQEFRAVLSRRAGEMLPPGFGLWGRFRRSGGWLATGTTLRAAALRPRVEANA